MCWQMFYLFIFFNCCCSPCLLQALAGKMPIGRSRTLESHHPFPAEKHLHDLLMESKLFGDEEREATNELPASTPQKGEGPPFIDARENASSGPARKRQNNNNNNCSTASAKNKLMWLTSWNDSYFVRELDAEQAGFGERRSLQEQMTCNIGKFFTVSRRMLMCCALTLFPLLPAG